MEDDDAFKARVLEQRWYQGALIPWRGELAREIARVGLRSCDLRASPGRPARSDEEPEGQFALISQLCDLTVGGGVEPFAVAMPAGMWDPDPEHQLPLRNSSRYFVLDPGRRLVASQALPIAFPKELLPDEVAVELPINAALFATWCARRWRRIPLPDDFTETVQRALAFALERVREPSGLSVTLCWRVQFLGEGPAGAPSARLVCVYDSHAIGAAEFSSYVFKVTELVHTRLEHENRRRSKRVPEHRPFVLEATEPVAANQLSIETALEWPMLIFDHLSPEPDPDDPDLGAELREEDVV